MNAALNLLLRDVDLIFRLSRLGDLFVEYFRRRALDAAASTKSPEGAEELRLFAANLDKAFYGFEPDFFQHNLLRMIDEAIAVIKASIELWPTLVEICYFQTRNGLPMLHIGKGGM